MFRINIEDILDKKVSCFDSGACIILPKKYKGKKAKVVIYK